ncbi:hypothetical protein [Sphingomonas sp. SRS2]|uniref:hypothetical protein n=1 Tax=Sphingomonas sp. SRS2 TaxID=133190 RepID=UPI0006184522|nr:hypothetical protein [Sphingomonas sp. SRS2]KKC24552.1 hypothetical protein WP12_18865 [Sphingomonas sp. SRS2]
MDTTENRKFRESVDLLGLRAQVTAVGFVQLAVELKQAGILDEAALGRIKDAICGDLMLSRPAAVNREEYERSIRRRLDALFQGREPVGKTPPGFLPQSAA